MARPTANGSLSRAGRNGQMKPPLPAAVCSGSVIPLKGSQVDSNMPSDARIPKRYPGRCTSLLPFLALSLLLFTFLAFADANVSTIASARAQASSWEANASASGAKAGAGAGTRAVRHVDASKAPLTALVVEAKGRVQKMMTRHCRGSRKDSPRMHQARLDCAVQVREEEASPHRSQLVTAGYSCRLLELSCAGCSVEVSSCSSHAPGLRGPGKELLVPWSFHSSSYFPLIFPSPGSYCCAAAENGHAQARPGRLCHRLGPCGSRGRASLACSRG